MIVDKQAVCEMREELFRILGELVPCGEVVLEIGVEMTATFTWRFKHREQPWAVIEKVDMPSFVAMKSRPSAIAEDIFYSWIRDWVIKRMGED